MSPPPENSSGVTFAPAQPQRWCLLESFRPAVETTACRSEVRAWCGLAILSLAIAGVFALLLALSRLPGIEDVLPWPLQFFDRGLVIHVVFSFVVWFLSVFGALLTVATYRVAAGSPRWAASGRAGVWAGVAGTVLLAVPGLTDAGAPSLNNYVPVIVDPLYYAGLAVLAAGVGLVVVRLGVNLPGRRGPLEPVAIGSVSSGFMYAIALVCFAIAYAALDDGLLSGADNEDLFWGGGHILQFVNTGLLVTAWYVLGGVSLGRPPIHPRQFGLAVLFLAAFAGLGAVFMIVYEPFSAAQTDAFTLLQYGLAPPVLAVALAVLIGLAAERRAGRALPWGDPAFLALALSALVFGVGGGLGLFVDGADTRTPAHYHGVIGGVNIAFMGLFFALFLPLIGRARAPGKAVPVMIHLYAWGQVVASLGLFLAGGYGAPRKVAGEAQGLEEIGAQIGLYMNGVGALIAVIGGIMFIVVAARALLRKA